LEDDPTVYYILGTYFMTEDNQDPKEGRIIVFHYNSSVSKLTQISEKMLDGGCFTMIIFNKILVATVNHSVS